MAFVKHRHDQMHRGQVPADQLAEGADEASPGDVPTYQYDGTVEWAPQTGEGGVSDHGALTGLADDDHPQYTTEAEAEAIASSAVGTHTSDGSDAHDASAVSVLDTGGNFTGTDVEAVLAELAALAAGGGDLTSLEVDLSVSGATNVDRDTAATHDLTLTGNATLTPVHSDPPTGEAIDLRILIRQDGTGSHTLAWGGTITWAGGSAPTMPTAANALLTVGLLSVDDGSTWLGFVAEGGSAGTPATTVESETTFGISPAVGTDTEYARQDHTHGTPADPVTVAAVKALGRWEPVQFDDGSSPWPFVYVDDEIVVAFVET